MKNIKYLLVMFIAMATMVSCVDDESMEIELPPVEGSVLKLNEIMSKDVDPNPDWIEVYNSGNEDMDISGYWLNDKPTAEGGFEIPGGTIIKAGGFYVVDSNESGESVSSGGEDVSLSEPDGTVIDHTKTPDMSNDVGLTWGREIDGEGEWMIGSPTKGSSNGSAENTAPILGADPLTEFDDVYAVTAADADGISSVKLVMLINEGVESIDMALVDGEYKTSVPKGEVGDVVKYYVVATDNTGLTSYYPENGSSEPAEFSVAGGVLEIDFSEVETGVGVFDFTFTGKVHYVNEVDEVRVYYVLNDELHDETVDPVIDTKDKVKVPASDIAADGTFKGTIEGLAKGDKISYYVRVEYLEGTKTYYPIEETDVDGVVISDFNHDLSTSWPSINVGEIPVAPINGFSELEITNEAGADLKYDVKVAYDNGAPQEVKFYYIINYDAATYVEDNDRHSVTWEGDLPTADNMYDFMIPAADLSAGDKVSWYIRAKDGNGDKMYYTFGQDADFDKDVIANWNVVTKN
ncbi:MAG: lamin tail domain-containing protein [Flavobacteriaceae bacterium]|nr:lamin tail domain-containing protein [Flavobacteriaceae bacterium]